MEQSIEPIQSPKTFALSHTRSKDSFRGCSHITQYEFLGKLGEGTFGEVHRARCRRTNALVALKKIIMHHEKDGFPITALREIKLLKILSHKNILRLEDMAVEYPQRTVDKRKRPIMYMVTPYMDHDLSGLLDNPSVPFTEPQIKCYLLQLLEGLRYLHHNRILHRDMKAANLLINNQGILQIADFGLARTYDGPVPRSGGGGGEGRREYTGLVVTRWYRPPELLLSLKEYTTAIDMWGVGCVFGEMLTKKPILAGESEPHQLEMIWDLVGSPTEDTMPGWKALAGAAGLTPRVRPGCLSTRFREHGSGAVALLRELLKLNWRTRINAIDALQHPYFKMQPLPLNPSDIPTFEESHELDRRKFHDRRAALPPAPKGGTVGMGPDANSATTGFNAVDGFSNGRAGGTKYPPVPGHGFRNGTDVERKPAWARDRGLPPRPPPPENPMNGYPINGWEERERLQRSRVIRGPDIDTYIPLYGRDGREGPPRFRDDRPLPPIPPPVRDDRRVWDDRRHERERERDRRTRSRSHSPTRDRPRDWDRDRDRERDRVEREPYRR